MRDCSEGIRVRLVTARGQPSAASLAPAAASGLSRYWLVSAVQVVQVLSGWRAVARR
jgi:hypothetical protein